MFRVLPAGCGCEGMRRCMLIRVTRDGKVRILISGHPHYPPVIARFIQPSAGCDAS